ncbi:nucleotide sugar dehydrogenase [Winogradskyella haliclonae]|uniref:UDP-N-acetyl-D-galactosamine dehydrogenase n=1 Tax=Winogradskyella haliclonae TaxID=2048558 RepID=A0ABQ2BX79_9FLAO|nr:nucleotide sugar dehydrogenase [Winogradskyella haliclonae]GGI56172.1 UDP-N-acetyl-D-galactosamine dehydrogenase [Winogradskyella haliclonae]
MRTAEALKTQFPLQDVQELKVAYKKTPLFEQLLNKEVSIAVVGLGYVGLPLAVHMASKFRVQGFDVNTEKVLQLLQHKDPCEELDSSAFENKDISFSFEENTLAKAKFYIVAVPTPIDSHKKPNLNPLKSATATVAKHLKKGDCVVFESTVYPGCTEEVCVPILERISRLKFNKDFTVGYSPERINPGDKAHTFTQITKVVSGSTKDALELIANVYNTVVTAGVHKASSLKVAEASKVVENIQRDVNIGLMNELAQIFNRLDVPIKDVLESAGTKWNFQNYFPGLVGGHCIGVDPYYLIDRARQFNFKPALLEQVRSTNESMITHIVNQITKHCRFSFGSNGKHILVKGITFKEDVNDIRNSKVADIVKALIKKGYKVTVEDPYANAQEVQHEYGFKLTPISKINTKFNAVIMAVNHSVYQNLENLNEHLKINGFVYDIRGTFKHLVKNHKYITL